MKKKILGLDLGTNSIGWALVEQDFENKEGEILGMGSRIIPMDAAIMGDFDKGNSVSQTANRTKYRSKRKLYERHHLRRERLHRVLYVLGFLPEHYADEIDFEKRLGKFKEETEPKLVWKKNGKKTNGKVKFEFIFQKAFNEMVEDFKKAQTQLFIEKAKIVEGKEQKIETKIPYDWTIYYLRKKSLIEKISKEELAWLILNFNQKRGYYQLRGEEEEVNENVKEFVANLTITKIEKGEVDKKNDNRTWYKIIFSNDWQYNATFTAKPNWENTEKEFLVIEEYDETGNIKIVKDKFSDTTGREKRKITPLPTFEEIEVMSKKDQDKIYGKIKTRTELTIKDSGTSVGTYIFETLLKNPKQKINGKLVRTIEREFYKDELRGILKKQIELQPELFTDDLYNDCVRELYRSNKAHQLLLGKRDFVHLFLEDIIFYQRPLKSQKSTIGNCSLEFRLHKINKKDENGNVIKNVFEKDENGKDIEIKEYLKAISKSNPYYQEFRVWQWIKNLSIYKKEDDTNVTLEFLNSSKDYERLFALLMTKKEVNHKDILEYFLVPIMKQKFQNTKPKAFKEVLQKEIAKYRWNYVFDDTKEREEDKSKNYPMNETGYEIKRRLKEVTNVPSDFLTAEIEYKLWQIIYSVTDKNEFEKALETFARKHSLHYVPKLERNSKNPDKGCFVENFKNFKPFKSEYGAYSEKAIKKLMPLLRIGKYWSFNSIDNNTKARIQNLQTAEVDESIRERVREQVKKERLGKNEDYQGLPLWLAQYVVYDRHSEASDISKWHSVEDLKTFLKEFKQHSLRNPIVEQVITETLRVVQEIWKHYGKGAENFFEEIHIELGREMKNTAEDKERITKQFKENETTNFRIKALLMEFANDDFFTNNKDYRNEKGETPDFYKKGNNPVRAYSPSQLDILKIYEEIVINKYSEEDLKNEKTGLTESKEGKIKEVTIYDISQKSQPTKAQIEKYKLWLEQKYRSPYTGKTIPLSQLFTPAYQIEHIIPQSRYFDDSISNKVICETEVNSLKDRLLGLEFIKNHHGEKVQTPFGEVEIFQEDAYKSFVNEHYDKNRGKKTKLLLDDIPDKMIMRQMNDTRYISKFISLLLSHIVRADKDDDGVNSKNIIPGNGKITSILKQDWGLNDVWNGIILPRFERMNTLTQTTSFTLTNKEGHTIPAIPFELSKGFQKKRIDHRHHAMDALVIACATRDHVNLLNNQSAKSENSRYDLQNKLRNKEKWKDNTGKERDKFTEFKKPWEDFIANTKSELEKIVVSFKQNFRVINKATNYFEKIENGKKVKVEQKGANWAIRHSLHEETVSGIVNLPWVKIGKGEIIAATRKPLDKSFNVDRIKKITDTGIQKILLNYSDFIIENTESLNEIGSNILLETNDKKKKELESILYKETAEIAFSPEGVEQLNKNIHQFNDGKYHQPIYKVRVYEKGSGRFNVGIKGNKKDKYVQGAPNLFFALYTNEQQQCKGGDKKPTKRCFETIPLNIVIERQKQGLKPVPEINELGEKLLFHLSPDDLVYIPTVVELETQNAIDFSNLTKEQIRRLFFVNDFSGSTCYFRPNRISKAIVPKEVDMNYDKKRNKISGSFDTKTASFEGEHIKDVCIKLKLDRLGNISKAGNYQTSSTTNNNAVSEPEVSYTKRNWTLKSFNSFEAMEQDQLANYSAMPPIERLKALKELTLNAFGFKHESEMNAPDRKLKFDE
ncbi:MAG: type II CRISPR RNA-guided endonuclease Cas9 [Chitinophagaceae bacterium]|nr:type II CRISPR RNA-guided endonuclease Cas9 [Chitinophagaceae bacterium]